MIIIDNPREMQNIANAIQNERSHGFIPTMGALHDGHLNLIKESLKHNKYTTVSIFVNPMQFGKNEDLSKYPRQIEDDKKKLEELGVNYLFFPNNDNMYPLDFISSVKVNKITEIMCGKSRPDHFEGVTTVCLKLFNIVKPTNIYFGQKDYQQCIVIKKMLSDLNLDIKMNMLEITREDDNLAMSSRNVYLNEQERKDALILYNSLCFAEKKFAEGIKNKTVLRNLIIEYINDNSELVNIDYVEIRETDTLNDIEFLNKSFVIALAIKIGKTRLIDNRIISM